MPKVLQLTKKRKEMLITKDGAEYEFIGAPISPDVNFMQLILNDEHADELLEKYSELVKEVPKNKIPERYAKKIEEQRNSMISSAIKDKPILKEFMPDKYKKKEEVKEEKPEKGKFSSKK